MAHHFDAMSDEGLQNYLTGAAIERGERFVIEERGDEWFAELRTPDPLAGKVVPMGDHAAILPEEAVILGVNGPDRRTAMMRLADHVAAVG